MMTRADHRTGTDRIAEVAAELTCDIVVNVQGDEPLIEPAMIDAVDRAAASRIRRCEMATVCAADHAIRADYTNPNVVKVVADAHGDALYFSRAPIPVPRRRSADRPGRRAFKHIGLYALSARRSC